MESLLYRLFKIYRIKILSKVSRTTSMKLAFQELFTCTSICTVYTYIYVLHTGSNNNRLYDPQAVLCTLLRRSNFSRAFLLIARVITG